MLLSGGGFEISLLLMVLQTVANCCSGRLNTMAVANSCLELQSVANLQNLQFRPFKTAAAKPLVVRAIDQLRNVGLQPLLTLGKSMHSWMTEIASMWRFSRSNAIAEGFHTKMEMLQRRAFEFRNFNNYR